MTTTELSQAVQTLSAYYGFAAMSYDVDMGMICLTLPFIPTVLVLYCALVFAVSDESTLPSGLWPLILESASDDASILYYLLTVQPHLVTGRTRSLSDRGRYQKVL